MNREIPSDVRKSVEEGVDEIEEAIKDVETRELVDGLIRSYSELNRHELFGKTTYLGESLRKLCGKRGAELILNLLGRGSSEGALRLMGEVKSNDVKKFLESVVMKYGAQYQWLFDPFPKDWQRYRFSTKYFGKPPLPVISMKIVDKSGNLLELECPVTTYIDLVVALAEHLNSVNKEMKDLGQPHAIQKIVPKDKLKKIKKAVEEILETPEKEKPK